MLKFNHSNKLTNTLIARQAIGWRRHLQSHLEHIKIPVASRTGKFLQLEAEWKPLIYRIRASLFKPILAPIFQNRWILSILTIAAGLQMGLSAWGIPLWQCPIRSAVKIPCPGCGLSSALASLIRGEWRTALQIHVFAPVFLMGVIIMGIFSVLPGRVYFKALTGLDALERVTGFTVFLSAALIAYWCLRMIGLISC